jgi:hypothetical protein
MKKEIVLKYRELHWSYFSLHAEQRLKTFHFYLIVAAILIGAFINIINEEKDLKFAFILPFILAFISFIFYKIDQRARFMLKNSQDAIRHLDSKLISNDEDKPSRINIFEYDAHIQSDKKRGMNYSKSFGSIFMTFGVLSIVAGCSYLIIWVGNLI